MRVVSRRASTYADAVLRLPGLIGHWRMNEASGTVAAALGAAPDGTYTGGFTLGQAGATRDGDRAASFNGTSGYVIVPQTSSDPALNVGDVFTLAALVKPAALGNLMVIVSGNRSNNSTGRFYLRVNTDGKIELDRYALNGITTSTSAVDATRYWHVACTKSGSAVKLYLDAADVTGTVTNATMDASPGGNTAWTIGAARNESGVFDGFFNGSLDEVSVWNRAHSAAAVASLRAAL